ncbi:MAG: VWA domain-containing protein [Planctomycetes bacterium]|nr:VWA domain-containing protein [Planctomycetota bacterium]
MRKLFDVFKAIHFLPAGSRWWYRSLLTSLAVHLLLVLILAALFIAPAHQEDATPIQSGWVKTRIVKIPQPLRPPPEVSQSVPESAAAIPGAAGSRNRPVAASLVRAPLSLPQFSASTFDEFQLPGGLAETGTAISGRGSTGSGNGGAGDGDHGSGFFGIQVPGKSFVYVIDCSGSMNRPHDSQWKTRFRRLKVEIVKSVNQLGAENRFYIIFFNRKPIRMPARTMQPAGPKVRFRYLKWMARQSAVGRTDPRAALQHALNLRPDVIYFLTDGSFDFKIKRDLSRLRQSRTAIHTFAFGDSAGEAALKTLAQANGGKYHFIP